MQVILTVLCGDFYTLFVGIVVVPGHFRHVTNSAILCLVHFGCVEKTADADTWSYPDAGRRACCL